MDKTALKHAWESCTTPRLLRCGWPPAQAMQRQNGMECARDGRAGTCQMLARSLRATSSVWLDTSIPMKKESDTSLRSHPCLREL